MQFKFLRDLRVNLRQDTMKIKVIAKVLVKLTAIWYLQEGKITNRLVIWEGRIVKAKISLTLKKDSLKPLNNFQNRQLIEAKVLVCLAI